MSQTIATVRDDAAAPDDFLCPDGADAVRLLAALLAAPAGCEYDDLYIAPGCDAGLFLGAVVELADEIGGAS